MLSSTPAERFPAMCGSETLATLVSSTSMKTASITVKATSHGWVSPFLLCSRKQILHDLVRFLARVLVPDVRPN